MNATKLMTYTLIDRGYDCTEHGAAQDCEAETLLDAIRQMDGFGSAAYAEPTSFI